MSESTDWRAMNRLNWDERVSIHLAPDAYDLAPLRAGRAALHPIEDHEIGDVRGLRILHLQCHFGKDTLTLAQKGAAEVVGLDFSGAAIAAARTLAAEVGLQTRTRFVESDLYDALAAIPEHASFDRVFVTWGAICWLPDIREWAKIVAAFLKPGGSLYLAEGHPSALVFDDAARMPNGLPGFLYPYFAGQALVVDDETDYANEFARLENARTTTWMHTLADIIGAILDAGLTLSWYREHDAVPWKMFEPLEMRPDGMYAWPDERWLPLAFSLEAKRPIARATEP